jgi:acyl transferase domain-containing protein
MKKQIIFMFSGQGSQYYQMGKELYENHTQFRYWMDHCDEIVQSILKTSLVEVLYRSKGKGDPFDNIVYSNPALLCVEYSLFKVLKEMDIQPGFLLGYSLGEIIASVVSGAISLEDGTQLTVDIARLAEEKTQTAGMLAIVESPNIMSEYPDVFQDCWLTGRNFNTNFVVAGLAPAIHKLHMELGKMKVTTQILPVSYGFHTELIDPIEVACKERIRNIKISPNRMPIISSLKTEIIQELNEDHLWDVIRYPVNFEQTVNRILKMGDYIFIDSGPSGTLATCVKYMLPPNAGSITLQMMNQFGRDLSAIEKLRNCLFAEA